MNVVVKIAKIQTGMKVNLFQTLFSPRNSQAIKVSETHRIICYHVMKWVPRKEACVCVCARERRESIIDSHFRLTMLRRRGKFRVNDVDVFVVLLFRDIQRSSGFCTKRQNLH